MRGQAEDLNCTLKKSQVESNLESGAMSKNHASHGLKPQWLMR